MTDPVNAADVLLDAWNEWRAAGTHLNEVQRDALLAYGGGDPVVLMPDGTLLRAVLDEVDAKGLARTFTFTDPVQP